MIVTASRLASYRACPRKHQYRYIDELKPRRTAEALHFGTLVHQGLETWWTTLDLNLALASLGDADPYDRAKAEAMLIGYDARWREEPLEVLAVESEFQFERAGGHTLAGKIDAIVRDDKGRIMLVEHKTSSEDLSPGSDYWSRLRLDAQLSIYYQGARALGFDVQGCIYDVLRKPGERPLKINSKRDEDETPTEYRDRLLSKASAEAFARGEVVRLADEESAFNTEVSQWIELMERTPSPAPRNPSSCFDWGRPCDFFGICSGSSSPSDFDRVAPFEELTQLRKGVSHAAA